MGSMFDDTDDKVLFKNIEPTRKETSAFQIPKKLVSGAGSHNEDDIDSDDDFQDPPQRQKHSEDEDVIVSKKVFDKFRDKVWKEFNDMRGLLSSRCDQIMNAINEIKNQAKDTESDQPPTNENVNNTSSHQATPKFDHEFNKNLEDTVVTKEMAGNQINSMNDVYNDIDGYNEDNDDVLNSKLVDGSIVEAQVSKFQFTFSDDVLRSIDLDFINKATAEVDVDCKNKEAIVEMNLIKSAENESEVNDVDKSKLDQQHKTSVHIHDRVNDESNADQDLPDSQITLPDELLPSLNAYVNLERSIIVHPSVNEAQQTPMHVSRVRRPSRYKESPFTMNFGSADEVQWRTSNQKHPFISHSVNDIKDTKITNKFMTWLSLDLLKYHSKRCIYVYDSLSAAGHGAVVLSEIEKLAKVISICLIAYKFYENKGIDIDNHPNYKLNEKMNLLGVSVVENVPQQSSGSLEVTSVPSVDFDPDLIRIRYALMLWDYATRKAEVEAQSDEEAPMRPLRKIKLTEGTEVHDI
ncbi:hypothetical protein FXO38_13584 [Capsicum annuum]|nr:hypothetical protein FXO38_13584 [Capsicum annuum]